MKTKNKLSQEEVEKFFEQEGCKLLSQYNGSKNLVDYQCCCGNVSSIKYKNFKSGHRCSQCRLKKISQAKKLSHQDVEKYFCDNGCELLEQYNNSVTSMNYRCCCGVLSKITWTAFKRGSRCDTCGRKKHSGELHPKWISDRDEVIRRRRLRGRYRNMLSRNFELMGKKKNLKSEKLLGYTCDDLFDHIHKCANFEKISKDKWHIDHIFPIKAFLEHGIEDVSLINCLENLRPMPALDNWRKNDCYDVNSFNNWLNQKGWFLQNGKYVKLPMQFLGSECSFYVPSEKIEKVEVRIHEYFINQHNAYTIEIVGVNGFWRETSDSPLLEEKHNKYVCGIREDRIEDFVAFLSEMCALLKEKAIYLTMGKKSYLVFPEKENDEI